jgi:hypothetical protein
LFAPSEHAAKQTQRYSTKLHLNPSHSLGITLAPRPFELDEGGTQMQMSSISILAVGSVVIAPLAGFLRCLPKQSLRVASTSEELLDLFEDRCALLEEHATPTSPNDAELLKASP